MHLEAQDRRLELHILNVGNHLASALSHCESTFYISIGRSGEPDVAPVAGGLSPTAV
jgi:hypothetical protein